MRVKVMDGDGTIRLARAKDVPQLLQLRDLVEFACEAEELYDALDPPLTRRKRYDWREESEDACLPSLRRHGDRGPAGASRSDPDNRSAETEPDEPTQGLVRSVRR